MLRGNFEVDVREHDFEGSVTFYFHREIDSGYELMYPVEAGWNSKKIQQGDLYDDLPHLKMSRQNAKRLYAALGRLFVPNKNVTEEQLKATQYHLEDMRRLVFENAQKI